MSARVSGSCVDVNCQAFIGLHSSVGGPSSRMGYRASAPALSWPLRSTAVTT